MLQNKVSFKKFVSTPIDLSNLDKNYISDWNNRSLFAQMLDAWGEMNYAYQSFCEYQKAPSEENKKTLINKANNLHNVCNLIINNPNLYKEEKETLRFAEWQFYNYIFGYSKDASCIKWFDQWCYDINYDLL